MARYTGPMTKKSRRLKTDLVGGDQAFERRPFPPGQHGRARTKEKEYLTQLQEKQKARFTYGVMEKQFRRYYEEAAPPPRQDRRDPAADPRVAAGQRRLPRGPGPHPAHGPPAGDPRPLPGQRRAGRRPVLPRVEQYDIITSASSRWRPFPFELARETFGDRPIPAWLQVVPSAEDPDPLSCPVRAQIDTQVTEQLIVELYSK